MINEYLKSIKSGIPVNYTQIKYTATLINTDIKIIDITKGWEDHAEITVIKPKESLSWEKHGRKKLEKKTYETMKRSYRMNRRLITILRCKSLDPNGNRVFHYQPMRPITKPVTTGWYTPIKQTTSTQVVVGERRLRRGVLIEAIAPLSRSHRLNRTVKEEKPRHGIVWTKRERTRVKHFEKERYISGLNCMWPWPKVLNSGMKSIETRFHIDEHFKYKLN